METEAVVEEGLLDVGILPCNIKTRTCPPVTYCVKLESFDTMSKLVKDNGDNYESLPFSACGYNWYVHDTLKSSLAENKTMKRASFVGVETGLTTSSSHLNIQ
ncbi:hypothetical protein Bca52824_040941 [Brassica carinata]|uniref:MATH domain-containing protein n=1 Tax=Brassica carinata TaxID=52824 RepID=A0A8X7UXA7_BRACI|nr:hypothetical protein Bca52824_040941 [Brassica carinata]